MKNILNKTTEHRIFYIDGKSGWGKSSLLVALKGKLKNKQNKEITNKKCSGKEEERTNKKEIK